MLDALVRELDILIRAKTDGRRSIDDVMRLVFRRYGGEKGFYATNIEQCAAAVCPGGAVAGFFKRYVYKGHALDLNTYLRLIGLKMDIVYRPAANVDERLFLYKGVADTNFRVQITHPGSCWATAGLHTGDEISAIDGVPVKTRQVFTDRLRQLKVGDTVLVTVARAGNIVPVSVVIRPYVVPAMHLSRVSGGALYEQWVRGE